MTMDIEDQRDMQPMGEPDLSMTPPEDPAAPGNCWHDNTNTGGSLKQWPLTLQTTQGTCGAPVYPDSVSTAALTAQVACDSGLLFSCPSTAVANYPATTTVTVKPLPAHLATMPNPCAGVPVNPWCPASTSSSGRGSGSGALAGTGLTIGVPLGALVLLGSALVLRRRLT